MDSKVYKAILKTICYADVFDYPLTEEEVYRWLKDIKILRYEDIRKANGVIKHKDQFLFLKGREDLLAKRSDREDASRKKFIIAKRITAILKCIPTIKLIGVSGSVAAYNAEKKDDIDLFIVTKTGTLWLTRLVTTIIVELFSNRRRPNDSNVSDKICLNMFVDENYLSIPKEKQNLYTAHEVCQLKALYDRDNTYKKFLVANSWVREFLPNAMSMIKDEGLKIKENKEKSSIMNHQSLIILEPFAKQLQLWYMKKHRTTEIITDGMLAFHPKDYTHDILTAFEKRFGYYASQV